MKYLRRFTKNSDYQAFLGGGDYIEPHVAMIENNGTPIVFFKDDGPIMISFTIEDKIYQAEDGMTWGQWINSKYNDGSVTSPNLQSEWAVVMQNNIVITKGGVLYQYTKDIIENGYNYIYEIVV